jgi:hypothetical protein
LQIIYCYGGRDERKIKDKLDQHNHIIKEYGWRMNVDKTVTLSISSILEAHARIRVNGMPCSLKKLTYVSKALTASIIRASP